jgi:cystinosin
MKRLSLFCVSLCLFFGGAQCTCDYRPRDGTYVLCATQPRTVEVGHTTSLRLHTNPPLNQSVYLNISFKDAHIIDAPDKVELEGGNDTRVVMKAKKAGITTLSFSIHNETETPFYKLNKVKREVSIIHATWIYYFSMVVGWIYFAAWSISFYPQIIENFRRRSVVGLNFDFLALNITGFVAYGVFNVGMFWIPEVQEQYKELHPGGVNPVQINDVVFTLHAIAATAFTIFQCFIFERGKQRVSIPAWILLALLWLAVFVSLFVSVGGKLSWLNFLYVFSYVKLAVTLVKYIPQVWMRERGEPLA